jgi:hypothetical protein
MRRCTFALGGRRLVAPSEGVSAHVGASDRPFVASFGPQRAGQADGPDDAGKIPADLYRRSLDLSTRAGQRYAASERPSSLARAGELAPTPTDLTSSRFEGGPALGQGLVQPLQQEEHVAVVLRVPAAYVDLRLHPLQQLQLLRVGAERVPIPGETSFEWAIVGIPPR